MDRLKSAASFALACAVTLCAVPGRAQGLVQGPAFTLTTQEQAEADLAGKPEAWFIDRLKAPRPKVDGDLLDARIQYILEQAPPRTRTVEGEMAVYKDPARGAAVRAFIDRSWAIRTVVTPDMASVEDRRISGRGGPIPVRVYRPRVVQGGPLPVLVYYHGGGFVFASIAALDRAVRLIANEARVVVVSVDYRLAPEHPYPAAHDDAQDTFLWTRAHAYEIGGDPQRIAVGGDSAGGNLAIATSLRQIKAKRPAPIYQLLYYPATSVKQDFASYRQFDHGYSLERPFMEAVSRMAFPKPAPEASPLEASSLSRMPATILVTAGYDPLRDQGAAFAARLEQSGVSTLHLNYGSLVHGFLNWSACVPDAEVAARQTAAIFGQAIRSRPVSSSTP